MKNETADTFNASQKEPATIKNETTIFPCGVSIEFGASAVEYGYRVCESGMNLQTALHRYYTVMTKDIKQ